MSSETNNAHKEIQLDRRSNEKSQPGPGFPGRVIYLVHAKPLTLLSLSTKSESVNDGATSCRHPAANHAYH